MGENFAEQTNLGEFDLPRQRISFSTMYSLRGGPQDTEVRNLIDTIIPPVDGPGIVGRRVPYHV